MEGPRPGGQAPRLAGHPGVVGRRAGAGAAADDAPAGGPRSSTTFYRLSHIVYLYIYRISHFYIFVAYRLSHCTAMSSYMYVHVLGAR